MLDQTLPPPSAGGNMPPERPSDEATEKYLHLAREQGAAFGHAVLTMTEQEAHGQQTRAGEYVVGYAIEEAEGMYHYRDGELVWQDPTDENTHVEIVVRDGADGRFVPGLKVQATLVDSTGTEVGTHEQPFLWHPWLYHYGRNWKVPGEGKYTLRVSIAPPEYSRHDKINGNRFARPVDVEFKDVQVTTGQKIS